MSCSLSPSDLAYLLATPTFHVRTDTPAELELIRTLSLDAGADAAVVSNHWAKGGEGAVNLAEALMTVCESQDEPNFRFLYDVEASIESKIETICNEIYGADGIELSEEALKQVETYTTQGYGGLPSEWLRYFFGRLKDRVPFVTDSFHVTTWYQS